MTYPSRMTKKEKKMAIELLHDLPNVRECRNESLVTNSAYDSKCFIHISFFNSQ